MRRYYYSALIIVMFLMSCKQDRTVDVTVMPEETTAGKGTFGCVIEGWLYVGGRYYVPGQPASSSISFRYDATNDKMNVEVKVKDVGKGYEFVAFTINAPVDKNNCTFTNARWKDILSGKSDIPLGDGIVEITRFDKTAKIISGRNLRGGTIEHGQFDVIFQ